MDLSHRVQHLREIPENLSKNNYQIPSPLATFPKLLPFYLHHKLKSHTQVQLAYAMSKE